MDPMIKNSFFTILIYWNDNRIHLGLTKKLIFFIWFPPLVIYGQPLIAIHILNPHVQTVQNMYGKGGQRVCKAELRPPEVDPYFERKKSPWEV